MASSLRPSARKFMEKFLIQRLTRLLWPEWEEDVPTNKLMNDFTVSWETAKTNVLIVELNHHHLHFPIHVPGLKWEKQSEFRYGDYIFCICTESIGIRMVMYLWETDAISVA
jgi:hypothetical protein